MKKTIALLLFLCLCISTAMADVTPAGTFPIADPGTTLKVWAPLSGTDDYNTCLMTSWFEEKTGLKVEWTQVSSAEWQTLFNTAIAGKDYPDIFMPFTLTGAEYLQFAEDGVLIPLNDLIDEYGYYLKQVMEANPQIREEITAPDGNIYGFPAIEYSYSSSNMNKLWVYREWLDKYTAETGKTAPTTPAELKDMLIFFRDNDMNGNGDTTDEIVLTGNYNRAEQGSDPSYYILNAYCFLPSYPETDSFLYVADGQVKTDVMTDAYRDGLKFLNELYKEGLFPEEIFVQDLNTMRSLTTTTKDKVIAGCVAAPFGARLLNAQSEENTVGYDDYVEIAPLKGSDGIAVTPSQSCSKIYQRCFITSSCENPEIAFRWMDMFYSDEVQQYVQYGGVEGTDWNWVDSPSLGGGDRSVRQNWDTEKLTKNVWNGAWVGIRNQSKDLMLAQEATTASTKAAWAANTTYEQYAKDTGIPFIVWCEDPDLAADFAEQEELFKKTVKSYLSEFVLGLKDVNSDEAWNEYLTTMNNMHTDRFLEIATEYYGVK